MYMAWSGRILMKRLKLAVSFIVPGGNAPPPQKVRLRFSLPLSLSIINLLYFATRRRESRDRENPLNASSIRNLQCP